MSRRFHSIPSPPDVNLSGISLPPKSGPSYNSSMGNGHSRTVRLDYASPPLQPALLFWIRRNLRIITAWVLITTSLASYIWATSDWYAYIDYGDRLVPKFKMPVWYQ